MRLFTKISQWFWVGGLATGVVLFTGFVVMALLFACKDHDWRLLVPATGCAAMAVRIYEVLDHRLHPLPPSPEPLDVKFNRVHD